MREIRAPGGTRAARLRRAFAAGARHAEPVEDPRTLAAGLRVPRALGAFMIGALERAVADGRVGPDDEVVLFNTGSAQKYVEAIRVDLPIATEPIDWASISTDGPT